MLALIGILLVFAAVFGGYLLEKGNPYVLMQPAELLIIGGSAIGIIIVSNPPSVIRKMARGLFAMVRPRVYTSRVFLRNLRMLYEVFAYAQRSGGMMALEGDVDRPAESRIFSNHPEFLKDHLTRDFVCDSLRMLVIGATAAQELDHLLDLDIDVQRRGHHEPAKALAAVADSLPGLGIVAAVLGVVITMEAIGGAPETVGQKVAAALVGTFLGILLCYGVAGPLAARLEHATEEHSQYLQVLRVGLVAFARGASPLLAVEYARRSIPEEVRPGFMEMETIVRREAKVPPTPKEMAHQSASGSSTGQTHEPLKESAKTTA
jgi:chemotaxis protein MotA